MANIVLCFDGTWNTPDHEVTDKDGDTSTNVWRLHRATTDAAKKYYHNGVGTDWYNKYLGGIFGVGLSKHVQDGYEYLINNYEDDDKIFIFGFSRGAYTARSLVGLIRNAGLLHKKHKSLVSEAYSLYRTRDGSTDTENAKWFREQYSRMVNIHFLGVWDTVGELGVPIKSFEWFNQKFYGFHDHQLSSIVKNAYHAVAIDEHRAEYMPTLWSPRHNESQNMQQVWFLGAHADVGGGYSNDLANPPLAWMMQAAEQHGLTFMADTIPLSTYSQFAPTDSYRKFLNGAYQHIKERVYRTIGSTEFGNESIHPSVEKIIQNTPCPYQPKPKNIIGNHLRGYASGGNLIP